MRYVQVNILELKARNIVAHGNAVGNVIAMRFSALKGRYKWAALFCPFRGKFSRSIYNQGVALG